MLNHERISSSIYTSLMARSEKLTWSLIFEALRNDPSLFRSMRVEEGTITWPNGADIDPDVLYYGLTPSWAVATEASSSESQFS